LANESEPMRIVVSGSSGHLGEALVRTLVDDGHDVVGMDVKPSLFTNRVGSIADSGFVKKCLQAVDIVLHAATLHKPHVATHSRQEFIDTNISGTLNLLEEAVKNQVRAFVYTSTTSTFGDAMRPAKGEPAVWVTEDLKPEPKNIYGVTKTAAEDLCQLFSRNQGLPCVVLRTSRFFPEADDDKGQRQSFIDDNLKVNELLFRRVDVEDIVTAHKLAMVKAREISFDRFIISATTPFKRSDAARPGTNAPEVLAKYQPHFRGGSFAGVVSLHDSVVLSFLPQTVNPGLPRGPLLPSGLQRPVPGQ
jgi:UDP-glucose 4-epimerase